MKKFKTGLLAFALLLGVSGALVSKIHAAPRAFDSTYNWHRVAGDPQPSEIDPLNGKTTQEAKDNYGCDGVSEVCAVGSNTQPGQPGATIFLSE